MEPACEQTNDSANCFEQAIAAIKLQSVSQLGASLSGLDPDLLLSVDNEGMYAPNCPRAATNASAELAHRMTKADNPVPIHTYASFR